MNNTRLNSENGNVMLITLVVMLLLTIIGGIAVYNSTMEMKVSVMDYKELKAFYEAEKAPEIALAFIDSFYRTFGIAPPEAQLPEGTLNQNDYEINYKTVRIPGTYPKVLYDGPYAGLNGIVTEYRVQSVAYNNANKSKSVVFATIESQLIPIFQFAIFFEGDIDFNAGPEFWVNGAVHSNSNIYCSGSGGTHIKGKMTAAKHIYRGFHRGNCEGCECKNQAVGSVFDITNPQQVYKNMATSIAPDGWLDACDGTVWKYNSQDYWGGNVKDSTHGVFVLNLPIPDEDFRILVDRAEDNDDTASFESKATLKIIETWDYSTGVVERKAYRRSEAVHMSNDYPAWTDESVGGDDLYQVLQTNGVVQQSLFCDFRERMVVKALDINIGRLNNPLMDGHNYFPPNGVMYAYVDPRFNPGDPDSNFVPHYPLDSLTKQDTLRAVRIYNSAYIGQPLTIATYNPAYTRGDINYDRNRDSTWNAQRRQNFALFADAITILSTAWIDGRCNGTYTTPGGIDADGDGYTDNVDCNDADNRIFPGAVESCDGVDNDMDGYLDGMDSDCTNCNRDEDSDGYYVRKLLCDASGNAITDTLGAGMDCDDNNNSVKPGVTEIPSNNIDDNCNGVIDEEGLGGKYTECLNFDRWVMKVPANGKGCKASNCGSQTATCCNPNCIDPNYSGDSLTFYGILDMDGMCFGAAHVIYDTSWFRLIKDGNVRPFYQYLDTLRRQYNVPDSVISWRVLDTYFDLSSAMTYYWTTWLTNAERTAITGIYRESRSGYMNIKGTRPGYSDQNYSAYTQCWQYAGTNSDCRTRTISVINNVENGYTFQTTGGRIAFGPYIKDTWKASSSDPYHCDCWITHTYNNIENTTSCYGNTDFAGMTRLEFNVVDNSIGGWPGTPGNPSLQIVFVTRDATDGSSAQCQATGGTISVGTGAFCCKANTGNCGTVLGMGGYSRVAASTYFYGAIAHGNIPTIDDRYPASGTENYSGGPHNFPRFLENWGGQSFNYWGSMVQLWNSKVSRQKYRCCWPTTNTVEGETTGWNNVCIYSPPIRNWRFDELFLYPEKLPPATPTVFTMARGGWAQRIDYEAGAADTLK